METNGSISAAEASAALASVRRSQARVAWTGYPAWYWLATGAGLAALPVMMLLPGWWDIVGIAAGGTLLIVVARYASRARGVCEGWALRAPQWRGAVLFGPAVAVMLADGFVTRSAWWPSIVAAVLVFVLFTGTGFLLSARAARR